MGMTDALITLRNAVALGVSSMPVSIPGVDPNNPVHIGEATPEDLQATAKAPPGTWLITVVPTRFRDNSIFGVSRVGSIQTVGTSPIPTIGVTSGPGTLTFSGTSSAGLNVHAFVGIYDAYYQTVQEDTLTTLAQAVATGINVLSISGASASASGPTVTVTGGLSLACNIAPSSGTSVVLEYGRTRMDVQVSIWCNNPLTRLLLRDAVKVAVGNAYNHSLMLPDGTWMMVQNDNETINGSSQSSYGLYESQLFFECEFGDNATVPMTQIAAAESFQTINSVDSVEFLP